MLALFRDDARVPVCPNASELVATKSAAITARTTIGHLLM
jgi:hypothetical protein